MGKGLNPADQFRKEQKKNEIKKNKKVQDEKHRIQSLLNDSRKIDEEITKLEKLSQENRLDKSIKDKIKEFQMMKSIALKKEKVKLDTARLRGDIIPEEKEEVEKSLSSSSSSASQQYQHPSPSLHSSIPMSAVSYYPGYMGSFPPRPLIPNSSGLQPYPNMMTPHMQAYPAGLPPQSYMSVGGVNGIPLPPPPRPVFAIGGQYGIPPPPPRPMIAVGGQHGIPPPPPRPTGPPQIAAYSAYGASSVIPRPPTDRHGRVRQQTVIDPLDPSHSKYTERFQTDFMKPVQDKQQLQQSMVASEYIHENAENTHGVNNETEADDGNNDDDDDDDDSDGEYEPTEEELEEQRLVELRLQSHLTAPAPDTISANIEPSPPVVHKISPVLTNSFTTTASFSKSLSDFSVSASMAELIMKRRHMATIGSGEGVIPSRDMNVTAAGPRQEAVPTQSKNIRKQDEEKNALSSLLGGYSDDDDDDDDEDDDDNDDDDDGDDDEDDDHNSKEEVVGNSRTKDTTSLPIDDDTFGPSLGPSRPPEEYSDYMYPEPSLQLDISYQSYYPDPTSLGTLSVPSDESKVNFLSSTTDYSASSAHVITNDGAAIPAPKQGKLLKVIRPDSALTAFLPTSLRAKRPMTEDKTTISAGTLLAPSAKTSKVSNMVDFNPDSIPNLDSVNYDVDSYDAFMNEINQL